MKILIPTYGRAFRQTTFNNLPAELQEQTYLVVQDREKHLYKDREIFKYIVLPPHIQTIGATRQLIIEKMRGTICMLDDDLEFAIRREDDRTKFRGVTDEDMLELFDQLQLESEVYPLVGISAREGANRNTDRILQCTRQMRAHVIDTEYFRKNGIRFDRVQLMEDFDVILQILSRGDANGVVNGWVTNQGGSNTEGGCSEYRTPERQQEAANQLAKLWPGIVQCVRKSTKTSWGGAERVDVRIQWKKCYEEKLHVK